MPTVQRNPLTNRKLKYSVGSIHNVEGQGDLIIVEYLPKDLKKGIKNSRAVIRFLETGCTRNIQLSNILKGSVKDLKKPTVYGVGYLDTDMKIPTRESGSEIRRAYDLWANMIKRTVIDKSYTDVTVDVRWHSFKNFLNSLPELDGYEAWRKGDDVHLDKDIKVKGSRVYSKDTCSFVSAFDNVSHSAN